MILQGDCIERMKELKDNSVDAIVTDPPYGLEFMGKDWDFGVPGKKFFVEMIRVLKPGGFLLSFGGTRTYHRLVCGIEDAGFEIRDTIMWIYGSGFPKSLNIGKQIDKMGEANKKYSELNKELCDYLVESREKLKLSQKDIAQHFLSRTGGLTGCVWNWENGANIPTMKQWGKLKELLKLNNDKFNVMIERAIVKRIEAEREVVEKKSRIPVNDGSREVFGTYGSDASVTAPATPEAKEWEGWGTALKPACEPICVARKPLSEKNVALNVLKWGTGGINIDESRIGNELRNYKGAGSSPQKLDNHQKGSTGIGMLDGSGKDMEFNVQGRFPANIILDEEAGKLLDEQTGELKPQGNKLGKSIQGKKSGMFNTAGIVNDSNNYKDKGGASRFFYCAKASKSERNLGCEDLEDKQAGIRSETSGQHITRRDGGDPKSTKNNHPTVKPLKLMEYLVKLVSKEGATVLDPFLGSGTTAIACIKTNRMFIGIEKEPEYIKIAEARLKPYLEQKKL